MPSERTIGRLSLYRRLLYTLQNEGGTQVFSHELAALARTTPAQVRRDLMAIGATGSPAHGYNVEELVAGIGQVLDTPDGCRAALAGIGNLGRALLAYFAGRRPRLSVTAAFDSDPSRVDRVTHGCRCYPVDRMADIVRQQGIAVGIVAVPSGAAQGVADILCASGVRGLLNFAPIRLWVPAGVHVEDLDMTMSLEKVAYFAGRGALDKEGDR